MLCLTELPDGGGTSGDSRGESRKIDKLFDMAPAKQALANGIDAAGIRTAAALLSDENSPVSPRALSELPMTS
jgi:hypothetical protein